MADNYVITRHTSEIEVITLLNSLNNLEFSRGDESVALIKVINTIYTYISQNINTGSYEYLVDLLNDSDFTDIQDLKDIYPEIIFDEDYTIDEDNMNSFIDGKLFPEIEFCNDRGILFTEKIVEDLIEVKQKIENDLTTYQKDNVRQQTKWDAKCNKIALLLEDDQYLNEKYSERFENVKKTYQNSNVTINKEKQDIVKVFNKNARLAPDPNPGNDYYINVGNPKKNLINTLTQLINKINNIKENELFDEYQYNLDFVVSYLLYYVINEHPDVIDEGIHKSDYNTIINDLLDDIKATQDPSELDKYQGFIYDLYTNSEDWDRLEEEALDLITQAIAGSFDAYPYSDIDLSSLFDLADKSYINSKNVIKTNENKEALLAEYMDEFSVLKAEYEQTIGDWSTWTGPQIQEETKYNDIKEEDITMDDTITITQKNARVIGITPIIDGEIIDHVEAFVDGSDRVITLQLYPEYHNHIVDGDVTVTSDPSGIFAFNTSIDENENITITLSDFHDGDSALTINVQDKTITLPVNVREYPYLYFFTTNSYDILVKDGETINGINYQWLDNNHPEYKFETENDIFTGNDRTYKYRAITGIDTENLLRYLLISKEYVDNCGIWCEAFKKFIKWDTVGYQDDKCVVIDFTAHNPGWGDDPEHEHGWGTDVELRLNVTDARLLPDGDIPHILP